MEYVKVFISWSGERSKKVAELLEVWLRCVVQECQPWVSTRGLERGTVWFSEINDQLKETTVGIICLTAENKERPWIMFEAGALAKGLATSRICPLLIDLDASDVGDPLGQFNMTTPNEAGMMNLAITLNSSLGARQIPNEILKLSFKALWPDFDYKFREILERIPGAAHSPERGERDILADILSTSRSISTRLSALENRREELLVRNDLEVRAAVPSRSKIRLTKDDWPPLR